MEGATVAAPTTTLGKFVYSNILMHIEHPSKQQDDLCQFLQMRQEETFTDMIFVTEGGSRLRVHSIVLAAVSDLVKTWMETTFIPNLEYYIYLPDMDLECVQTLMNICYGVDTAVPQDKLDQLHILADMLGITVDLPFRISEPLFDSGGNMSVGGDKAPQELDDDNAGVDVLPLCCWHCNTPFADLETLKVHVKTHKGERFKSKRHKCQKCKKVLPSMWKLRQHLLTHAAAVPRRDSSQQATGDHQYADTSRSAAVLAAASSGSNSRSKKDDHPYATPPTSVMEAEDEARSNVSRDHSYLGSPAKPAATKSQSVLDDHLYTNKQLKGAAKRKASMPNRQAKNEDEEEEVAVLKEEAQMVVPPVVEAIAVASSAAKIPVPALNRVKARMPSGFPCDQCDKVFPQRYRRVRHVREVHDKERRHTCRFCEKSFFKITSRDRHQLTHVPDRRNTKWRCAHCHGMFTTETSLDYHVNHKVCIKNRKVH